MTITSLLLIVAVALFYGLVLTLLLGRLERARVQRLADQRLAEREARHGPSYHLATDLVEHDAA
jgi:hypothetical protein